VVRPPFGEVFELRRNDVDLEAGAIHIRRAVVRIDRLEAVGRPKSDAGVRTVAIPRTFSPLSSIISNATLGKHRNALLFTTVHGQYWTHGNFYKAAWIPTRTAATKSWTPFLDMPRSDVDCVANVRSFRHAQTPVEESVLTGGAEAVAGGERVGCAVHRQPVRDRKQITSSMRLLAQGSLA